MSRNFEDRLDGLENALQKLLGSQQLGSQKVVIDREDNMLPTSQFAISNNRGAALSDVLSWDIMRKTVGNGVFDDETSTASRLMDLYIENLHPRYPILSRAQLKIMKQNYLVIEISNTTEPRVDRKRSAADPSQLLTEHILFLLVLALAKKFDDASPVGCEGFPTENIEKLWMKASSDQNAFFEPVTNYFDAAAEIMERHASGCSLRHVQVYLLRSIYHGQRCQELECSIYLAKAHLALQKFLRQHW